MTTIETISVQRNQTLDVLRGIAIITMILSNYAGEMLKAPHPVFMTAIGSLAAPLFIIIAGYLVGYSVLIKNYSFSYFLLRGFLTLIIGTIIDVFFWKAYPFISVDVLYLIGLATPLTALFMRIKTSYRVLLILLLFGLAPLLRIHLGYAEKPSFPLIWKNGLYTPFEGDLVVILKHWLVDGWFPIFSWLGVAFLGGILAEFRLKQESLSLKNYGFIFLFGLFFLVLGILFWNQEFRYIKRENYTEMFYPPTLSYYSAFIGAVLLLYLLVEMNSNISIYAPLRLLGSSSLFFYFLHFLLITKIISPYYGRVPYTDINYIDKQTFFVTYFLLILFCLLLSVVLFFIKKKFPNPPFLVKFIIGG